MDLIDKKIIFPPNFHVHPPTVLSCMGCTLQSRPASSLRQSTGGSRHVPDFVVRELFFSNWQEVMWSSNQSQPWTRPIKSQAISCVILPSRLCYLLVCFFFFLFAVLRRGCDNERQRSHWSPSSLSAVSIDTRCRFKCVTYHDVCDMMGYHMQCHCCHMIIVCFFMFLPHCLSDMGFSFLLTLVVG